MSIYQNFPNWTVNTTALSTSFALRITNEMIYQKLIQIEARLNKKPLKKRLKKRLKKK